MTVLNHVFKLLKNGLDSFGNSSVFGYLFMIGTTVFSASSVLILGGSPTNGEDPVLTFLFALAIFSAGLGAIVGGVNRFKELQLVRNTPTSKIRSMAMGNVEIKGESKVSDKSLESPFSENECLYYRYKVEEYREDSDNDGSWVTITQGESYVEFDLDDGTEKATIKPEGANFNLPRDNLYRVNDTKLPPKNIKNFLKQEETVKIQEDGWFKDKKDRKYKEWYISSGEHLYVYGYADTDKNGDPIVREGRAPIFMISDRSEEEIRDDWSASYKFFIIGGILASTFAYWLMWSVTWSA